MADTYSPYGGVPMGYSSATGSAMPTYSIGGNSYYAYGNSENFRTAPNDYGYNSINDVLGLPPAYAYYTRDDRSKKNYAYAQLGLEAGLGLLNYFSQSSANKRNEALQRESWELNSYTHRVQEMLALGLNKQLATGANPNYSLQTSIKPQELKFDGVQKALQTYQALMSMDAMKLANENAYMDLVTANKRNHILNEEFRAAAAKRRMVEHDASIWDKRDDVATTDPMWLKLFEGATSKLLPGPDGKPLDSPGKIYRAWKEFGNAGFWRGIFTGKWQPLHLKELGDSFWQSLDKRFGSGANRNPQGLPDDFWEY